MAVFTRLKVPCFDLAWLNTSEDDSFVLMPGGGGATKCGVRNQILIAAPSAEGLNVSPGFETDSEGNSNLCSGICVGEIMKKTVVCALLESKCLVLAAENSEELKFHRMAEFVADKSEVEGGVNCCRVTVSNHIITGGEDGVCRIWTVSLNPAYKAENKESKDDGTNAFPWQATLRSELSGHKGPIMSLSLHPIEPWVSTASKDGTCKVWDLDKAIIVADVPCVMDGAVGAAAAAAAAGAKKGSAAAAPTKMECRGCCFVPDNRVGAYLYVIQSGRRGATHLIKWKPVISQSDSDGTKKANKPTKTVEYTPVKVLMASKVPSTRLAVNDTGEYLAVGTSGGTVVLVRAQQLQSKNSSAPNNDNAALKIVSTYECHDLPVTGLGFGPTPLADRLHGAKVLLASCSADNKATAIKYGQYSFIFKFCTILGLILVFALLILMTLLVISRMNILDTAALNSFLQQL